MRDMLKPFLLISS